MKVEIFYIKKKILFTPALVASHGVRLLSHLLPLVVGARGVVVVDLWEQKSTSFNLNHNLLALEGGIQTLTKRMFSLNLIQK